MGSLRRKEDFGLEDDEDAMSHFEILTKSVCNIARKTCMQQENTVPPKERSSYFNFLEDMPNPSITNTMPTTSGPLIMGGLSGSQVSGSGSCVDDDHQVVFVTDKDENSGIKRQLLSLLPRMEKRSQDEDRIQQIPNLREDCCRRICKKPKSPPHTIILLGQKIEITKSTSPAGTNASTDESNGQDRVVDDDQNEKKMKKVTFSNDHNKNLKKNNKWKWKQAIDEAIPDLPEEFKQVILGDRNGAKLQFLVQKTLSEADVKTNLGRLSLPRGQVSGKRILKRNEGKFLKKHTFVPVPLIDPRLEERKVSLGWWKMSKSNSYVLKSTWNNIVEDHELEKDDVVQVWSFRAINPSYDINHDYVDDITDDDDGNDDVFGGIEYDEDENDDGQLHLVLVVVKRAPKKGDSKESTSAMSCDKEQTEVDGSGEGSMSCHRSQKKHQLVDGSSCGSCSPVEDMEAAAPS